MKKIFFLFSIFTLFIFLNCSGGGGSDPDDPPTNSGPVITDPTPPPPSIEDPSGLPVKATLITSSGTKFYDGTNVWLWKTGTTTKAQKQVYSNSNYLYALDLYGATDDYINLAATPDFVNLIPVSGLKSVSRSMTTKDVVIDLDEFNQWIVETIPYETAVSLGAADLPMTGYTRVYYNGVEWGNWLTRPYTLDNFIILAGDVWAQKTPMSQWVCMSDAAKQNIVYANSEFVVWNMNLTTHTATVNSTDVSFSYNFASGVTEWLKSSTLNKWYSLNGYTWDGTNFVENGSKMWDWRMKRNIVKSIGTHYENGEDVLYFIDCSTGQLIRFVPSANQYVLFTQLYIGDGTLDTGTSMKQTLKPSIVEDDLFFIYEAHTFRYSFQTGLVNLFGDNISQVMPY